MSPEVSQDFSFSGARLRFSCLLIRVETIYQGDEEGCGLACLRMALVLASHQKNYRYLTLEGHPPYSLEQLHQAAAKEGLTLTFKRVGDKHDLFHNTNWPVFLLLGEEQNSHCVLARKVWRNRILIDDPSSGRHWIKSDRLFDRWNGIYGEISSYFESKCPYKKKSLDIPWLFSLASVTEIASEAALYFGFYNVQKNADYLYSVLAFALFGLFSILKRLFAVGGMKAFDRDYLDFIYNEDRARLRLNYEHYYRYKGLLFGGWIEFVSALFFSTALTALIGFNNPFFFASAAGYLVFALAEGGYWSKRLQGEKSELENGEKALFASKEEAEEKIASLHLLNEKAYQLGDYLSYNHIIRFVLSLALALIPVLGKREITLNYFLFHFFVLLSIGEGFEKIVSFFVKTRERSQEFDYFLEYFLKEEK
ncbi:MAG: cysteine peptidase family C39 domain-containing protein [Bacilli bacterium]